MSRRLLFLAFPFPPSRGAGVYRTVAIANFLVSRGWDVTVVTPEEGYFLRRHGSEDRSLMDWPDPRIEVLRVPLPDLADMDAGSSSSILSKMFPSFTSKTQKRWSRFVSPLESYDFWFRPALKAAMRAVRSNKPDVVLATGNPFNSFLVANVIKRRTGIPYVLDYRDTWTIDQFTGQLRPGATDVALSMERRVLTGSSAYISVNRPIVDWLAEVHSLPERVRRAVIENGYDPELLGDVADQTSAGDGEGLVLAHVGTLIPDKQDWSGILSEFDQGAHAVDFDVELRFYGHLGFSSIQAEQMGEMFDSHENIRHHGPVGKKDVARVYGEADALFLPMYESPYHTGGKVYEMMAVGKPILAWGPDSAGAMEPLGGYPLLVRADRNAPETWGQSLESIARLAHEADGDLADRAKDYARRYERSALLAPLATLLEDLVG